MIIEENVNDSLHSSEDPEVEREQFCLWGVWRDNPHQDGEGGEG